VLVYHYNTSKFTGDTCHQCIKEFNTAVKDLTKFFSIQTETTSRGGVN